MHPLFKFFCPSLCVSSVFPAAVLQRASADLDKTQPRRLCEKSGVDENMLRDHCFCVGEMRRAGIGRSDGDLPLCRKGDAHPRLGGDGIITDNE